MSNIHQHVHTTTTYSPFSYLLESPIPAVLTHGASGTTVRGSHPPKKRGVGEGGKGRGGEGKGGKGRGGKGKGRGGEGKGGGRRKCSLSKCNLRVCKLQTIPSSVFC